MQSMADILGQAKRLPPNDRLKLIQELLLTLEPDGEPPSDAEWSAAWLAEIESRIAAYERGETQATDWKTALVRMRQALEAR
jgi:putative addiction module component (TIGR02574 family)